MIFHLHALSSFEVDEDGYIVRYRGARRDLIQVGQHLLEHPDDVWWIRNSERYLRYQALLKRTQRPCLTDRHLVCHDEQVGLHSGVTRLLATGFSTLCHEIPIPRALRHALGEHEALLRTDDLTIVADRQGTVWSWSAKMVAATGLAASLVLGQALPFIGTSGRPAQPPRVSYTGERVTLRRFRAYATTQPLGEQLDHWIFEARKPTVAMPTRVPRLAPVVPLIRPAVAAFARRGRW